MSQFLTFEEWKVKRNCGTGPCTNPYCHEGWDEDIEFPCRTCWGSGTVTEKQLRHNYDAEVKADAKLLEEWNRKAATP